MSENEMSQQERDARAVGILRATAVETDAINAKYDADVALLTDYFDGEDDFAFDDAVRAALRTIDRLRADNQRLRAVIQSAIVGLEVAGDFNLVAAALNERDHLRAALSADAATPADGNGNEVDR